MRPYNLLIALNLLAGCGYRWQPDYPYATRPSVTVPFATGDEDGSLTAAVIQALSTSGIADVKSSGGDYRLQIEIVESATDLIGFREDLQKVDGEVRKDLLACEERRSMTVQASLCRGEEVVHGPYQMTSDVEYDYVDGDSVQDLTFVDAEGAVITVLPFSLGQLESVESAQEAATRPLYAKMAQKIVDAISSEW